MKIIFITREGYDLAGARIRCYNFARELRKIGLNTEVLSFADTLGAKSGQEEHKLTLKDKCRYNLETLKRLRQEKDAIIFLNRFHYHSFAPWLLHLVNRNRLIFDLDDWEIREVPEYYFGFYPSSKAEFLIRKIAKSSNLCIAASHFLKNFLKQFNPKVCYIPTGVDADLFYPRSRSENADKIVVSWIGTLHRLDDIDNLDFLVDCFRDISRKHENVILEILGDGLYANRIFSGSYGKNIILKGWIHPDSVPEYLANIDIGVAPLIQKTKFNLAKSPAKLFEYMAMAKPVICSDIGECGRIIDDGKNGLLAKNKEEFMESLETLITDSARRRTMGENALETVRQRYSLKVVAENLYQAIKENLI